MNIGYNYEYLDISMNIWIYYMNIFWYSYINIRAIWILDIKYMGY